MITILCPHCGNDIGIIKVVPQDSLRGQNEKDTDVSSSLCVQNIPHEEWNSLCLKDKECYIIVNINDRWVTGYRRKEK